MHDTQFRWRPLAEPQHFRLLTLNFRCDQKSSVEVVAPQWSIVHFDLRRPPQYEALSYTWGGQAATEKLVLEDGRFILVSKTVWSFLTEVYVPAKRVCVDDVEGEKEDLPPATRLWIDAVCIDQENADEKSVQVSMISLIFSQAEKMYMWLGMATTEEERVLQVLVELKEFFDYFYQQNSSSDATLLIMSAISELYRNGMPVDDLISLSKLLGNAYFSRTWIIQEIAVARRLHLQIGKHMYDWEEFANTCERLMQNPSIFGGFSYPRDAFIAQQFRQSYNNKPGSRPSLLSIISRMQNFKCFDPRDKLFAVLSLTDERNLRPDYQRNVEDLYHSFAISCIRRGDLSSILAAVNSKSLLKLPSWVPDWSRDDRNLHFLHDEMFIAGGYDQIVSQLSTDGRLLQLQGVFLDSIKALTPTFPLNTNRVEDWFSPENLGKVGELLSLHSERMHTWLRCCEELITPRIEVNYGQYASDLLWRVLILNRDINGQRASPEHGEYFKHYRQGLKEALSVDPGVDSDDNQEQIWAKQPLATMYTGPLAAAMQYRVFVSTQGSRLAIVPDAAQAGDLICVFQGLRVPFVVRSRGSDTSGVKYQLIGEAYVHGIMEGEIVKYSKPNFESIWLA